MKSPNVMVQQSGLFVREPFPSQLSASKKVVWQTLSIMNRALDERVSQKALSTGRMKTLPLWSTGAPSPCSVAALRCHPRSALAYFLCLQATWELLYCAFLIRFACIRAPALGELQVVPPESLMEIHGDTTVSPQPCRISTFSGWVS